MTPKADNEINLIKTIASTFPRHPGQLNGIFEADCEIISTDSLQAPYLVVKTDGIQEEIKEGLYKDPYLIGWMALSVTISDMASTGAEPIGILLSLQLPKQFENSWIQELQRGINEACETYGTYILGGDTNYNREVSIATTGIGKATKPILRKGIHPGYLIYATASLGAGNGYAYSKFFDSSLQIRYKPVARLKESRLIRNFATACIDTSDGLFPAVSILAEINNTGLNFSQPLENILCTQTLNAYKKAGIPAWLFLAGPHGEYELLFSIPPIQQEAFEGACAAEGWEPILLGEATEDNQVHFVSEDLEVTCHPSEISNLFDEADGQIQNYFNLLLQKHQQWSSTKTTSTC